MLASDSLGESPECVTLQTLGDEINPIEGAEQTLRYLASHDGTLESSALEAIRDAESPTNPFAESNHGLNRHEAVAFGEVFSNLEHVGIEGWSRLREEAKRLLAARATTLEIRQPLIESTRGFFSLRSEIEIEGKEWPASKEAVVYQWKGKNFAAYPTRETVAVVDLDEGKIKTFPIEGRGGPVEKPTPRLVFMSGYPYLLFSKEKYEALNLETGRWERWSRPSLFAHALSTESKSTTETYPLMYAAHPEQSVLVWSDAIEGLRVYLPTLGFLAGVRSHFTEPVDLPMTLSKMRYKPGDRNPMLSNPFSTIHEGNLVIGAIDIRDSQLYLMQPHLGLKLTSSKLSFEPFVDERPGQDRQIQFADLDGSPILAYVSPYKGVVVHHPFAPERDKPVIPLHFFDSPTVVPYTSTKVPYLLVMARNDVTVTDLKAHQIVSSFQNVSYPTTRPLAFEWNHETFHVWGDFGGGLTIMGPAGQVMHRQVIGKDKIELVRTFQTPTGPKALVIDNTGLNQIVSLISDAQP